MKTKTCLRACLASTTWFAAWFLPATAHAVSGELSGELLSSKQPVAFAANGFPIYATGDDPSGTVSYELNAYLKQGTNTFTLVLPRADFSATSDVAFLRFHLDYQADSNTDAITEFYLERVLGRTDSTDAPPVLLESLAVTNAASSRCQVDSSLPTNRLVSANWDADNAVITHRLTPPAPGVTDVVTVAVSVPQALLASLPWDGTPPTLANADRDAIRALVVNLGDAIRTNDDAQIVALLGSKIQRFAEARGTTEDVIRTALIDGFNDLRMATPPYVFDPIDPQALQFVTYPGTALVEATLPSGAPIHALSGADVFFKRVFLVKFAGQWQIVD